MEISKQLTFLYELLMNLEERSLLASLQETPADVSTRNAYTDFLRDKGRVQSAEMVAAGFVPGSYCAPPVVVLNVPEGGPSISDEEADALRRDFTAAMAKDEPQVFVAQHDVDLNYHGKGVW